ncbi:D-3-phosphoglycerate dehydrogenase 1, chloroplastic [Artemisia annua]|uniref:D-3-phosphoglycerate dehydrogenase 1, chloroplastic n=1 Tax=Artemisia annua TaxID=35608 RepID=A0A2U1M3Z7_ARTAN|nr:D-3-phosphoglycerate dehydrogenase 1, chloroplastic [Artemisia annua]
MFTDSLVNLAKSKEVPYVTLAEKHQQMGHLSKNPTRHHSIQIADVESCFMSATCESGDIQIEGKVKDGVPHLTKLGAFIWT